MTSVLAIVLGTALGLSAASEQSLLDQGVRAYDEMELDTAAATLTKALRSSSSREKPRVELWLGIVELERGNEAAAKRYFRSALRASPRLTVKHELSPKILATIDEVRAQVARRPARARDDDAPAAAATPAAPAAAPAPTIGAAPFVATPVAPAAALVAAPAPAAPPAATPPAAAEPIADAAPLVPVADGVAQGAPPASPLFFAGVAAGAVSVGAIGVGAVFGTLARMGGEQAQRETEAAVATQRYQEASVSAIVANSLFVAGGVAAAVGATCGALALTESEEP